MTLAALGCTRTARVEAPTYNVVGQKYPMTVGLILDHAFCHYTHSFNRLGDTFVYPFGPALCDSAQQAVRGSFDRVEVFEAGGPVDVTHLTGGLFRPRVSRFNESLPGWATQYREALLVVEWALTNGAGQLLWLSSVEATASEPLGTAFGFKDNEVRLFRNLMTDLRDKSVKAFRDSVEIQRRSRETAR